MFAKISIIFQATKLKSLKFQLFAYFETIFAYFAGQVFELLLRLNYFEKNLQVWRLFNSRWGTICTPTRMKAADGKYYMTQASDLKGIFRIIQSIPSKKAEPVKKWLAEVGEQRIDQMIDPELTFQMAVDDYRRQGYSDRWINERMRSIEMRKELTDEWHRSGIHEPKDFAILTNVLTKAWSGMTTVEYKRHKGLTKQNLRDNMTNIELALNTLAEVATTEISKERNAQGMKESRQEAQAGGQIAKNTRDDLERQLGRTVISSERASDYIRPIEQADAKELPDTNKSD